MLISVNFSAKGQETLRVDFLSHLISFQTLIFLGLYLLIFSWEFDNRKIFLFLFGASLHRLLEYLHKFLNFIEKPLSEPAGQCARA